MSAAVAPLDRERLIWIYEQMLRIREFEERVKRTFLDHPGVIRGHTHLADGAEASIVGSIVRYVATSNIRASAAPAPANANNSSEAASAQCRSSMITAIGLIADSLRRKPEIAS